ncbi:MAG: hypothetical protein Q9162_003850 [Coniocarpon cinnabarinum]
MSDCDPKLIGEFGCKFDFWVTRVLNWGDQSANIAIKVAPIILGAALAGPLLYSVRRIATGKATKGSPEWEFAQLMLNDAYQNPNAQNLLNASSLMAFMGDKHGKALSTDEKTQLKNMEELLQSCHEDHARSERGESNQMPDPAEARKELADAIKLINKFAPQKDEMQDADKTVQREFDKFHESRKNTMLSFASRPKPHQWLGRPPRSDTEMGTEDHGAGMTSKMGSTLKRVLTKKDTPEQPKGKDAV